MNDGWHKNPDGTNSLRYFDGENWTDRIEWTGPKPADAPPAAPEPPVSQAAPVDPVDPVAQPPAADPVVPPAHDDESKKSRKGILLALASFVLIAGLAGVLALQLTGGEENLTSAAEPVDDEDDDEEVADDDDDDDEEVTDDDDDDEGVADGDEDDEATEADDDDDSGQSSGSADDASVDQSAASPATTATTTTQQQTSTSATPQCAQSFSGPAVDAEITGVQDWLNGRSSSSLQSAVVAELVPGQSVTVYTDFVEFNGNRGWVPIFATAQQTCAWVDMSFLKAGSRLLRSPSGSSYVIRALRGLDAEAAHASRVVIDPDGTLGPISSQTLAALEDNVEIIRGYGNRLGDSAIIEADLSYTGPGETDGCSFGDLFSCAVLIQDGTEPVARVIVWFDGNGVSDSAVNAIG